MNCKPGELAVVVKSWAGNEGRIVRCLRVVQTDYLYTGPCLGWETEPMLLNCDGEPVYALDIQLRPIRPGDISDEEVRDLYAPKQTESA